MCVYRIRIQASWSLEFDLPRDIIILSMQGRVFFHGATKISDGVSSCGIYSGQDPGTTTPFDKSGEMSAQHQNLPPR